MKKSIFLLLMLLTMVSAGAWAQSEPRPLRTPEEEALMQTEMLKRELQLSQAQVDTVYRIHLKYALLREQSNTRAEALERMNRMTTELLGVMTKPQQQLFLNKQMGCEPRHTQPVKCTIIP